MNSEATAAETAKALRSKAREHKRASQFHRRSAKRCMEELARLQANCAKLGIKLETEGEDPQEGSWPKSKTS